jgi:hypothetical protein
MLSYHEGSFYIMDETCLIKQFNIDQKTLKVKFTNTLEMNSYDKENFD